MRNSWNILLRFLFLSTGLYGGGGVDVGNGSKIVSYFTPDFVSDIELVNFLDKLKNKISTSSDVRVHSLQVTANCTPKVEIINIEKIQKYNINHEKVDFKRRYKGKMNLLFNKCKKIFLLPKHIGKHH